MCTAVLMYVCVGGGHKCLCTAAVRWGRLCKHEEVSEDQTVVL